MVELRPDFSFARTGNDIEAAAWTDTQQAAERSGVKRRKRACGPADGVVTSKP